MKLGYGVWSTGLLVCAYGNDFPSQVTSNEETCLYKLHLSKSDSTHIFLWEGCQHFILLSMVAFSA